MSQNIAQLKLVFSRVKPWLAIAVVLGVLLLGYYAVQGIRYAQASREEASLQKQVEAVRAKMASASPVIDAEAKLEPLQLQLDELRSQFYYGSTDDLVAMVTRIAQETGMNLETVSAGEFQAQILEDVVYKVWPMGVTLDGEISDLYRFLSRLHQEVPVAAASSIRLSGLDVAPSAQVQLLFYLSPEPVEEEQAG